MGKPFALIVEDEPDLATIASEALKAAGFETEIVNDGALAVQRLQDVVPVVVLLDLNLPHVSGEQILAKIRADSRLDNTRVMIATADAAMADMLENEADLVLLKPTSFIQMKMMAERLAVSAS